MNPEFSRPYRVDTIGTEPRHVTIEAESGEREKLAARFGLVGIESLSAEADLSRNGETLIAAGMLRAAATQSCVASGEPIQEKIAERFRIEFRPEPRSAGGEEEIELSESELDVVFYDGPAIDLGEAMAETLSLSLDPYPRSESAEAALREAGVMDEGQAGPFGALAGLKDKMKGK